MVQTFADNSTSAPNAVDGMEIVEHLWDKVDKRFQAWQGMIERMEKSMDKHRMKKWVPPVKEAIDIENAYTSRLDGVLSRKVIYSIAAGHPQFKIENDAAWPDRKNANENAERFAVGCFNIGNDRQRKRAMPEIQKQLAFFATVRGAYVVCRGLLNKDPLTGETFPDWLPMDPRNFVFGRRADGLDWCAYRFELTRAETRKRYPGFSFTMGGDDFYATEDETKTEVLYDYYQRIDKKVLGQDFRVFVIPRYFNGTMLDHQWARRPVDTQAVEWPIQVVPVGYMPELGTQSPVADRDTMEDFGEDVFATTDGITDSINLTISYAQQAIAQQVHRAVDKGGSGGGPETEEYPFAPGAETDSDTDAQQYIKPITPADIGAAPQVVLHTGQSEWYAAGLTAHALGQMPPGGLSGAALRLVGSNIGEKSHPFLGPVEQCIEGCLRQMLAQLARGGYSPMMVWGKTLSEQRFDRPIGAEDIQNHGRLTFRLEQSLPEDQYEKWAIAQMATQKTQDGKSLVPLDWAQSHLLGIQDPSLLNQNQDVERVKDLLPLITLLDWRESAQQAGEMNTVAYLDKKIEEEVAKDYLNQLVLKLKLIEIGGAGSLGELMAIVSGMAGGTSGNGQAPAQRGTDARVASAERAAPGTVGRNPSPEAGVNSPNPRPGGRNEEDMRLEQAGLIRG